MPEIWEAYKKTAIFSKHDLERFGPDFTGLDDTDHALGSDRIDISGLKPLIHIHLDSISIYTHALSILLARISAPF